MEVSRSSSGVAEDLAGASFAGQYETVLDVRGSEALADAVRRCWASAFRERVAAYAGRAGASRPRGVRSMAVLVQRLVPADAAGVAFTANPVTGDRSDTVVNAVRGLGERLASGQSEVMSRAVFPSNLFDLRNFQLLLGGYGIFNLLVIQAKITTRIAAGGHKENQGLSQIILLLPG